MTSAKVSRYRPAGLIVNALIDLATLATGRWGAGAGARELEAARSAAVAEDERLRIARELHDIVAHAVTLMVIQSGGARRVLARDPELAAEAMAAVESAGRQAVAEMRRLLVVLRTESGTRTTLAHPPTAGLAELEILLARVSAAGVPVAFRSTGRSRALDPDVDLAAYRLVQEALTNVHKHAGPGASAVVRFTWQPGSVVVEIEDSGPVQPPAPHDADPVGGFGLQGLTERIQLIGGRLLAGPRADSLGFRVRAVLPTRTPTPDRPDTPALTEAGRR